MARRPARCYRYCKNKVRKCWNFSSPIRPSLSVFKRHRILRRVEWQMGKTGEQEETLDGMDAQTRSNDDMKRLFLVLFVGQGY
jgi:hypothetical protein